MRKVKKFARMAINRSARSEEERKKVHFATLMDLCHLQNPELDKEFQKYQRTCGAEGIVRDDSGNSAVFPDARFLHHV